MSTVQQQLLEQAFAVQRQKKFAALVTGRAILDASALRKAKAEAAERRAEELHRLALSVLGEARGACWRVHAYADAAEKDRQQAEDSEAAARLCWATSAILLVVHVVVAFCL